MTVSVFCGLSVDGFIARRDGGLDFLTGDGSSPEGGGGFEEFLASVDALVMGRRTFDVVKGFGGQWPYGAKPVVVLSRGSPDVAWAPKTVTTMQGTPAEVVARLAAKGWHHLYVDGGETIQEFLRAGLVDRLILTRVPVLLGQGIPLFGWLPKDVRLRHVRTEEVGAGMVQTEYAVVR